MSDLELTCLVLDAMNEAAERKLRARRFVILDECGDELQRYFCADDALEALSFAPDAILIEMS